MSEPDTTNFPLTVHVQSTHRPHYSYTITQTREVKCGRCGETIVRFASWDEQEGRPWPEHTAYMNEMATTQHGCDG